MNAIKRTTCPKCGVENLIGLERCESCRVLLHEDKEKSRIKYRGRRILRWAAVITGLIGSVGVVLTVWFVFAFSSGHIEEPIGWILVLGTSLLLLGIIAATWKWELVGGMFLILVGGILLIILLIAGGLGILIHIGLLLLTSGILFIFSWREGRRQLRVTS